MGTNDLDDLTAAVQGTPRAKRASHAADALNSLARSADTPTQLPGFKALTQSRSLIRKSAASQNPLLVVGFIFALIGAGLMIYFGLIYDVSVETDSYERGL